MKSAVLVVFSSTLPKKPAAWWAQFSTVIASSALAPAVRERGLAFESLEELVDTSSIEEAAAFLGRLARATFPDGTRIAKSVLYRGYELWWIHYDELFYQQCLPYTQYRRLLARLAEFASITIDQAPAPTLFKTYLEAHGRTCTMLKAQRTIPSIGIWLQVLLSLISWPLLILCRPGALVYTGDYFDPPRDHSFRMRLIYDELRARKLPFVECIRSLEPAHVVLSHALTRRRPVIYSYAIKVVLSWLAGFFGDRPFSVRGSDPEEVFVRTLATMYLRRVRGVIWSIRVLNWIVRTIGIRAALIPAASSRTFHEVLACKSSDIPCIGILHGAASKYYNVYDFMPEYDGEKHLPLDRYGMWSEEWKDYYVKNSAIYKAEHLLISGPMRPLDVAVPEERSTSGPVKVLLVPGELSDPKEVMPYLRRLMTEPGISFHLTFRPYRDAFEKWLTVHEPELIEQIGKDRILLGNIHDAIKQCDIVVGSYSTGVLEALLFLKPIAFFHTRKWGDYFDLKEHDPECTFFAMDPDELVERILKSRHVPIDAIQKLQTRFFGNPRQNGSAWVVDEIENQL